MKLDRKRRRKMDETTLKVGQILEVKTSDGIHYERVSKAGNYILTETMPEHEDEDICVQGLTVNWEYRILSDSEIVKALNFIRKNKGIFV